MTAPHAPGTAGLLHEHALVAAGYRVIVGIDEAGRGAWAGPVAAGAVCLPLDRDDVAQLLAGVYDSKQVSARARGNLVERIQTTARAWGVGRAEAHEIDALGIVPATCLAMERALALVQAQVTPDYLLIDSIRWTNRQLPHTALIKGDSLSLSIAAASILAKVARDGWMVEYDAQYPGYGFAGHKGYGVATHHTALREHGPTPLHRMTFAPLRQLRLF
ncbi:MAG: ribonuclease HII [Chloroflexi bacterium]|nr:ribonuclease HII [Chloroflexota bacterium]